MDEYVKRNALIEKICGACDLHCKLDIMACTEIKNILNAPAADVDPVVHGRWEYHDCVCTGDGLAAVYACSNCRFCIDEEVFEQLNATDFCNCCGARMDGEGK